MSAKIIRLQNAKRGSVRCPETGVVFPQIYRLTGFCYKLAEGATINGALVTGGMVEDLANPADPSYTLSMELAYDGIAQPRWEPISKLGDEDKGLVFVRHHANRASLEGYIDAMYDTELHEWPYNRFLSFETDFGHYSLLHRRAHPGALDRALIFVTKVPDPELEFADWYHVIDSEGNLAEIDDIEPPDVQEDMQPIKDLMKS